MDFTSTGLTLVSTMHQGTHVAAGLAVGDARCLRSWRRTWAPALALSALTAAPASPQSSGDLSRLREPGIVGLVEMPWLYSTDAAHAAIAVHTSPDAQGPVVATLDRDGVRAADGRRVCGWAREAERADAESTCEFMESGYEEPALPVIGTSEGGWYRLAIPLTAGAEAWIQSDNQFHGVIDLLATNRLNYLRRDLFDGWLYGEPNGARIRLVPPRTLVEARELPYEPIEHTVVDGRLWLYVRMLAGTCDSANPIEFARGWVPAKRADGTLQAWFWSRGC